MLTILQCLIVSISYTDYNQGTRQGYAPDFVYKVHDVLSKVPMVLHDNRATSTIVDILGSQLLYSATVTRLTHAQGFHLSHILSATSEFHPLTTEEMQRIYSLAVRRLER